MKTVEVNKTQVVRDGGYGLCNYFHIGLDTL
jgi:hypothetical protein